MVHVHLWPSNAFNIYNVGSNFSICALVTTRDVEHRIKIMTTHDVHLWQHMI